MTTIQRPAAAVVAPILDAFVGEPTDVRFEFWDQSVAGPSDAPTTVRLRSPNALRRLLWAPGELGLARAYAAGELDLVGDPVDAILALRNARIDGPLDGVRVVPRLVAASRSLGLVGPPPAPPAIESRPRGRRHGRRRDSAVISHHYDVGNEFYRLLLGPSMTYSCARFAHEGSTLEAAQESKHELVCRKLGLDERADRRLLDVGCGWGAMALHAARHHGARVVGVTLSAEQADWARSSVAAAGLTERIEIRLADYRSLRDEPFDAISSIGMFEHVGASRRDEYFATLARLLVPEGRFVNHAISSVGGSRLGRRSFMYRYVFPDGELLDVADVVTGMEGVGLEVRDVESLREHYAQTLRAWIANLEAGWDDAVRLVGLERAQVWRLYLAGSAVGFIDGGINVHQALGIRPAADGRSGMPRTRDGWSTTVVASPT